MKYIYPSVEWVVWNISLAAAPVVLAVVIYMMARRGKTSFGMKLPIMILGVAWLAFMPNSCYLLTQWRHFLVLIDHTNLGIRWQMDSRAALDLMNYTLFYLCYSGVGVLAFALGIRPIDRLMRARNMNLFAWGLPFFLLMSIGVYLGLVLRFNSWDIVLRPAVLWQSVAALADRPMLNFFIVSFAAFLWILYIAMDIWIDGLLARWRTYRARDASIESS